MENQATTSNNLKDDNAEKHRVYSSMRTIKTALFRCSGH